MKTAFALAVMVEDSSIALLPISGCSLKPPGMSSTDPRTTSCKSISAPDSLFSLQPAAKPISWKNDIRPHPYRRDFCTESILRLAGSSNCFDGLTQQSEKGLPLRSGRQATQSHIRSIKNQGTHLSQSGPAFRVLVVSRHETLVR